MRSCPSDTPLSYNEAAVLGVRVRPGLTTVSEKHPPDIRNEQIGKYERNTSSATAQDSNVGNFKPGPHFDFLRVLWDILRMTPYLGDVDQTRPNRKLVGFCSLPTLTNLLPPATAPALRLAYVLGCCFRHLFFLSLLFISYFVQRTFRFISLHFSLSSACKHPHAGRELH